MLKLDNIVKVYKTGGEDVTALRKSEAKRS